MLIIQYRLLPLIFFRPDAVTHFKSHLFIDRKKLELLSQRQQTAIEDLCHELIAKTRVFFLNGHISWKMRNYILSVDGRFDSYHTEGDTGEIIALFEKIERTIWSFGKDITVEFTNVISYLQLGKGKKILFEKLVQ